MAEAVVRSTPKLSVKGFLSEKGDYQPFLELSNLKVMTASPEYLLAMKCLAMRLGAEFHDEADISYLLRFLNIENYQIAINTISRYYPLEQIPGHGVIEFQAST